MYKFVVVTDPDSAPGFRLAGVDVLEAKDLNEAKKIIPPLIFRDDTGIVAVSEDLMAVLDDKMMEKIDKTYRPIIIPIPSRIKGISRTSYIERLLQRAIGYNIVIRR
ncbi:MAG: V-type ATP synthase subunit F [Methanoregula sp. PtaU1.Bin051]|nr:MAG: V-type ATP synthase subunit F [Methanoregula sp. PtaU1.Bin051]